MGNCNSGKDYSKYKKGMRQGQQGNAAKNNNPGSNGSFNPVNRAHVIANVGSVEADYTLISPPLGEGAFGEVRKAIHKATGLERAVKIIRKTSSTPAELEAIKDEVRSKICIFLFKFSKIGDNSEWIGSCQYSQNFRIL